MQPTYLYRAYGELSSGVSPSSESQVEVKSVWFETFTFDFWGPGWGGMGDGGHKTQMFKGPGGHKTKTAKGHLT